MTFNAEEFQFGTIYIDGTLKIDESKPNIKLKANNIWVRGGGKITIGSEQEYKRYMNNFELILTGTSNSPNLIIDDLAKTGTKSLAVTGTVEMYGKHPAVTQTRLAAIAKAGDTTITVEDDISDW